jgi:DNA-binding transcriptional LysR family regulator
MLDPDLRYLIQIASFRSMARTAEELGVSQSTLSRAVQRLEAKFLVTLVERTARGVELTDAGRRLVKRLRIADQQLRDAERELADMSTGRRGLLRIAVGHTVSSPVIRALVPRLRKERPATHLQVDAWYNDQILPRLIDGEYDFAICVIPSEIPPELVARTLLHDHLVPVVRAAHPLTQLENPCVADLVRFPWAGAGSRVISRAPLDALFESAGVDLPVSALESNSFEMAIDAIKGSDCVTFAPDWMAEQSIGICQDLAIVRVDGFSHARQLGIIERKSTYLSPLATRAQELVIEALAAVNDRRQLRMDRQGCGRARAGPA